MSKTVKIYKNGDFTCVDVTINGKTDYYSSDKGRSLKVIPDGVQILPDPEEKILNNFKILISELEDDYGTTTGKELRDELLTRNFFKKGGGGVSGGESLESFTLVDTTLGKYNSGDIIPAHASNNERWKDLGRKRTLPIFYLPIANITASTLPNNSLEVGTTLTNILFTATLTQNDGGAATNFKILKDNVEILNDVNENTITETIELSTVPIVFKANINYAEGTISKNDSLGEEVANTIVAGNDDSSTLSYRAYRAVFYGNTITKNSNSSDVRLNLMKRLENTGNIFILNTGSVNKIFQLWLPNGKNLISIIDLDALNFNVTSSYISEPLTVNDIGGNPITGTLYTMEQSIPYTTNHRHQITIS